MSDEQFDPGDIALKWWTQHCHPETGDRATRARLRRCKSARDAMSVPAALTLVQQLGRVGGHEDGVDDALNLARVLAHVKDDCRTHLMRSCGFSRPPRKGEASPEQPRLAVVRFTRLMRSDRDELPTALIRLVRLLDAKASIAGLTDAVLDWSRPYWGDQVRRAWAFDYYGASLRQPEPTTTEHEGDIP